MPQRSFTIAAPGRQPQTLASAYDEVRQFSATLCETLEAEDMVVQTMPDVSPTK